MKKPGIEELNLLLARREETIAELDAILESVSDGIYITDGEGYTLRVNSAFEEITGISTEEVIGRQVQQLIGDGVYERSVSLSVLEDRRPVSIVETLKNGKDVLLTGTPVFGKDGKIFRIVTTLRDVAELNKLKSELEHKEQESELYREELLHLRLRQLNLKNLVVSGDAMEKIMNLAFQVGKVDSTVLITGESGVGKEVVARIIHRSGRKENGPLICANCSAIPENLLESELFGYNEGAFTGAIRGGQPGLFEVAGGGTLFLDEIGEISLNIQVKLLRVIQEREIMRLGGRKPIKVDVRIIAATNRDLKAMVKNETFRADLFYRLNVVPIHVPPLRERKETVLPLANHFLKKYNKRFEKNVALSTDAVRVLEGYNWPGNVRELENTIERVVVLDQNGVVQFGDLPEGLGGGTELSTSCSDGGFSSWDTAVEELERRMITSARTRFGSTRKIAVALGISQSKAVRMLARYGAES